MMIAQSGASDAEKRKMVKNMELQIEGENMEKLMTHLPEVKATEKLEKSEQKEEPVNEEETTNEHGDTVAISQAAREQYEQSSDSALGSDGSSAAVQPSTPSTSREDHFSPLS